ncbi:MAG TPA: sialidase family protein [bacterium]|nr:sialidase family protein [bacterium]
MRKLLLALISGSFLAFQVMSCGGDNDNNVVALEISPEGPTIVRRDATLQFSANVPVSWTVEGGDSRGTIDANGLYTPPATLPVDDAAVSVVATTEDGQSAESFVELRAADVLSFSPALPINQTPIPFAAVLTTIILGPLSDRIAVAPQAVQVDSVWGNDDSGAITLFGQSDDFAAFSPEQPITEAAEELSPVGIDKDLQGNPMLMLVSGTPNNRIQFMASDDGGATFNEPVPVSTPNPTNPQVGGNFRQDEEGILHLVFSETDTSVLDGPTNVFYTNSNDGGGTWSPAIPLSDAIDDSVEIGFAFMGVSGNGQNIVGCWNEDENIAYSHSSDGGANFSAPQSLTSADENELCRVAVGPQGEFYITYTAIVGPDQANIVVRKSTDGGQTFGGPVNANGAAPVVGEAIAMISVDDLGRIDVVWISDLEGDGQGGDIVHARSLDGGTAFSEAVTVFDATTADEIGFPNGLRHDRAGRLYLQYFDVFESPADSNLFLVHGE